MMIALGACERVFKGIISTMINGWFVCCVVFVLFVLFLISNFVSFKFNINKKNISFDLEKCAELYCRNDRYDNNYYIVIDEGEKHKGGKKKFKNLKNKMKRLARKN